MSNASAIRSGVTALTAVCVLTIVGCASVGGPASTAPVESSPSSAVNEEARALLPDDVRDDGKLVVASSLDYPPFEYTTTDGVNEGFDIDLITEIGAALGLEVEIQQSPFEGEIAGLANNRFDVAMATFTIKAERLQQVNFVQFLSAGTVVSVLKGSETGITGPETLCGHTVGVQTGSAAEGQLAALNDDCIARGEATINASTFPDQSGTVQAVLNQRVEARLDDSTTTAYINEQVGGKLENVGGTYLPSPTGFAIAKNTPELLNATQAAMQGLIDDGTYTALAEKWGQTENTVDEATVYTDPAQLDAIN